MTNQNQPRTQYFANNPSADPIVAMGRVTRDSELRYTPSGHAVCEVSMVFRRGYQNSQGTWEEETSWRKFTFWRQAAERAAAQLKKGVIVKVRYNPASVQAHVWKNADGSLNLGDGGEARTDIKATGLGFSVVAYPVGTEVSAYAGGNGAQPVATPEGTDFGDEDFA